EPINTSYQFTQTIFKQKIIKIIKKLKHYEVEEIEKLMKISPKLSEEVFAKHNSFNPTKYDTSNAKAAIFTFSGDVYK
ncbi:peroxide stress protein YaaA, partial [Francisella tularensis subsp. holarctica]|uniref:peroxide stress protein YaaA n=1 Tax=Francisella tularensis TaxID=263 RepID=UPI002381B5E9